MARGLFISFEGADGVGKSTQIKLLKRALKRLGKNVHLTREPGGTPLGEKLRKILKSSSMNPRTELMIFEASRSEHVEKVIRPSLKRGIIVLSDRYEESSLIYQGFVRGLPLRTIKAANMIATQGLRADLIVLLDSKSVTHMRKRAKRENSQDRFEREKIHFHEKVARGFRLLARQDKRFKVYSAEKSVSEIHSLILRDVLKKLGRR